MVCGWRVWGCRESASLTLIRSSPSPQSNRAPHRHQKKSLNCEEYFCPLRRDASDLTSRLSIDRPARTRARTHARTPARPRDRPLQRGATATTVEARDDAYVEVWPGAVIA